MNENKWKEIMTSLWNSEGNVFFRFLFDAGLEINTLNKFGKSMLSYAAESGNLQIAEYLLQEGAEANIPNSDGSKPIHIAARYFRKNIVELLLKIGISVNTRDTNHSTPLHYAADTHNISSAGRQSCEEIIRFLVNHYADINAVNRGGFTPVHLAASTSDYRNIVELFIELGSNLECDVNTGWTVLHHACAKGWSGIVYTLLEGRFEIDLNRRTSDGYTPLLLAAKSFHEDIVHRLIESGAEIKVCDAHGNTLLHYFCQIGWLELLKLLVNNECDLNAKNIYGRTPMMEAAWGYMFDSSSVAVESVEYLIGCEADLNVRDEDGNTLLHLVCRRDWPEVVDTLLNKGCDIHAKNCFGYTPFLMAAKFAPESVIKSFLKLGVDVNTKSKSNVSSLYFVCEYGTLDMAETLIEMGAYFPHTSFYSYNSMKKIAKRCLIKEGILQNTQICTKVILNKYTNHDLPKLFKIPVPGKLPQLETLKIVTESTELEIAKTVTNDIETRGYCDVLKVRPMVLQMLCVATLLKYFRRVNGKVVIMRIPPCEEVRNYLSEQTFPMNNGGWPLRPDTPWYLVDDWPLRPDTPWYLVDDFFVPADDDDRQDSHHEESGAPSDEGYPASFSSSNSQVPSSQMTDKGLESSQSTPCEAQLPVEDMEVCKDVPMGFQI